MRPQSRGEAARGEEEGAERLEGREVIVEHFGEGGHAGADDADEHFYESACTHFHDERGSMVWKRIAKMVK